jgi:RNA polymerase sigma-70 factor, ECF subfamily
MTWEFALERRTEIAATASELPMDSEAFTGFYERSARPLWAYLVRVSGNPALSEDLMQESFVRFLCAAHRCEGEVEARRYLFRIATNLLRDYWRRPVATSIEELPEAFFASNQGASDLSSEAILGQAMTKIKPRERQLLWLAHAEGYSHREIAEVMGLGPASVRLLLFRARRKLASALKAGGAA